MRGLLRRSLSRIQQFATGVAQLSQLPRLSGQTRYLQREVERLRTLNRRLMWEAAARSHAAASQTRASFDFQWEHLPTGKALPTDSTFMATVADQIASMVGRPREWFTGRRIADIGCGMGRYTFGFLQLGARVVACDQSEAALRRTAELCRPFADRLALKQVELLDWDEAMDFDVAFSFGVVHHTGNTYRAIENVGRKVGPGGRLFLMVYNVPVDLPGYQDVNAYETIAEEHEELSFIARRDELVRRFGADRAHGWFDATSPRINDRLTFGEIRALLRELGFVNITGRIVARDHYVVADRPDTANAGTRA